MQIPSYNGSNDWLSSRQKSNGDGRAHKNPNGSISDSSRTPQRPLGVQRPVPLRTVRAPPTSHSADSWREKVMGLFDPALQDAEDLMLSLPYTAIRMRTDQLANALDEMGSLGLDESSNRQHPILRTPIKARSCPARLTIHSTSERSRIKKAMYEIPLHSS